MRSDRKSCGNHFRRVGALLSALLMICCMTAPALASNNWPASPSASDFDSHPFSWYVWQRKSLDSRYSGYELICCPMLEYQSSNTSTYSFSFPYFTDSSTYFYTDSSSVTHTLMFSRPYIPFSSTGYWAELPSFPVGYPTDYCGAVRIYPVVWRYDLQNIDDIFNDRSVFGYLTSWPSSSAPIISDYYSYEIFSDNPIYIPTNIFFFGEKTDSSSTHTSFGIRNGDNNFWATPSNSSFLKLGNSHFGLFHPFASNQFIPSSDVGFVFCKRPSGDGMHVYNSEFNIKMSFVASLWVPDALLPADVKVGDWISKADVESLQDQLTKDFDVNSDTLKNSKQNFDSWQNSNTIDTDIADIAFSVFHALFGTALASFVSTVVLLCFGAVVLRILLRKALE